MQKENTYIPLKRNYCVFLALLRVLVKLEVFLLLWASSLKSFAMGLHDSSNENLKMLSCQCKLTIVCLLAFMKPSLCDIEYKKALIHNVHFVMKLNYNLDN